MHGISCDRCGAALLVGSDVRYVVTIDVRAAWDPLEMTREELAQDHAAEIRKLLLRIEGMTEEELMRQVHCSFRFDLCPACQRIYTAAPLP